MKLTLNLDHKRTFTTKNMIVEFQMSGIDYDDFPSASNRLMHGYDDLEDFLLERLSVKPENIVLGDPELYRQAIGDLVFCFCDRKVLVKMPADGKNVRKLYRLIEKKQGTMGTGEGLCIDEISFHIDESEIPAMRKKFQKSLEERIAGLVTDTSGLTGHRTLRVAEVEIFQFDISRGWSDYEASSMHKLGKLVEYAEAGELFHGVEIYEQLTVTLVEE